MIGRIRENDWMMKMKRYSVECVAKNPLEIKVAIRRKGPAQRMILCEKKQKATEVN